MTPIAEPKLFQMRDQTQRIHFRGHLLSSSTSLRSGNSTAATRWTEIRLYRTAAGQYVAHVVGRSNMAGELDRSRVYVCATADALVDQLHRFDERGVRYLTRVATAALEQAGIVDPALAEATRSQWVA